MDVSYYMGKTYSATPCWDLVSDVYNTELDAIAVDYKTVNKSVREMASAFRIAIHKSPHGFSKVEAPVDMCVVLMGRNSSLGVHHCGIYYEGKVLHATTDVTLYEELSVIRDRYALVEFWYKP